MTEEETAEISRLAVIAGEKQQASDNWSYVNVAFQTADTLRDIYSKSAVARAEALEARNLLNAYIEKVTIVRDEP